MVCNSVALPTIPISAAVSVLLCLPCLAACGAALGLISEALRLEKLLVLNPEGEVRSTIRTLDCLVLISHWMTLLVDTSSEFGQSSTLVNRCGSK